MAQAVFEHDLSHFNPNRPFAGDDKLPIRFYMGAQQDEEKSLEEGRPIFRDVEYIQIFNSKDNIIDRPVRDTDKGRWPQQYNAWKLSGAGEPGSVGTPLEHWPLMTRALVEEFKYFKIYTVEHLADMPDSQGTPILGFNKIKAAAKAYVEAARGEAPLLKMQDKLDGLAAENVNLRDQLAKLGKQVENLMAPSANQAPPLKKGV